MQTSNVIWMIVSYVVVSGEKYGMKIAKVSSSGDIVIAEIMLECLSWEVGEQSKNQKGQ